MSAEVIAAEELPSVVQALSAAMGDIGAVHKDQVNSHIQFYRHQLNM